jgi:hypothetical protein
MTVKTVLEKNTLALFDWVMIFKMMFCTEKPVSRRYQYGSHWPLLSGASDQTGISF